MSTYGFCENKCKHEVYTKEETYSKEEVDNQIYNANANLHNIIETERGLALDEIDKNLSLQTHTQVIEMTDSAGVSGTIVITYYKRANICEAKAVLGIPYNFARNDTDGGVYFKATSVDSIANVPSGYIPVFSKSVEGSNYTNATGETYCRMHLIFGQFAPHLNRAVMQIIISNNVDQSAHTPESVPIYSVTAQSGTYIVDETYTEDYILGDVSLDGIVDETDLALMQAAIMGRYTLSPKQIKAADMNGDGEVGATDYVKLKNTIASQYKLGDVNMDGEITQEDLDLVNEYLLRNIQLTPVQQVLADVNKDGEINSGDTNLINKYIMGTIDSFE